MQNYLIQPNIWRKKEIVDVLVESQLQSTLLRPVASFIVQYFHSLVNSVENVLDFVSSVTHRYFSGANMHLLDAFINDNYFSDISLSG